MDLGKPHTSDYVTQGIFFFQKNAVPGEEAHQDLAQEHCKAQSFEQPNKGHAEVALGIQSTHF